MFKGLIRSLVAVWLGVFVSLPAMAVQVDGLFKSERLVPDQSAEQRSAAVKDGLEEVLVRVSGHRETLQHKSVQALLQQAESYLAQFSYKVNAQSKQQPYRLNMQFDGPSLIKALSNAQLSVWGGNRPSVLTWLAIQGPNGRFIVNSENNPLLAEVFEAEAKRRGVPLVLPLLDLEDERLVSVSDIWGQFSDRISAASVRYAPDAVYSGRFYRSSSGWNAHWQLQVGSQRQVIRLQADQVRELFAKSADALAEVLAEKYAVIVSGASSGDYAFKVVGLKSVADYAKLNHYLNSLQVVGRVEVARVDETSVAYRVALKGAVSQFLSVLALDSYLEPDHSGFEGVEQSFFWRP
ncbi:DUF2066 domain-containing protein [Oceanospirillum linum]|uniref:DUF2066 domain-containing protein n=1 Tax=Oceanospirillum linum TaxID=966 RepID=A0A1T1HE33_OCELI|nr:DUF2066 domain-containing protein [Oceanospirillum linum]OOV88109.1 hypothetical protein BTA35_0200715 [Oceanospirillum linum]SEF43432.1 hypothetical protein SAMN04489856_101145 [Oleiphilus messinensis]SMP01314.1 hypothetical protein SAMN06264348_101146 [Oceanospirillum linum]